MQDADNETGPFGTTRPKHPFSQPVRLLLRQAACPAAHGSNAGRAKVAHIRKLVRRSK